MGNHISSYIQYIKAENKSQESKLDSKHISILCKCHSNCSITLCQVSLYLNDTLILCQAFFQLYFNYVKLMFTCNFMYLTLLVHVLQLQEFVFFFNIYTSVFYTTFSYILIQYICGPMFLCIYTILSSIRTGLKPTILDVSFQLHFYMQFHAIHCYYSTWVYYTLISCTSNIFCLYKMQYLVHYFHNIQY